MFPLRFTSIYEKIQFVMTMQVVMPIAGRGTGFIEKGYKTPKPLIGIRGKPMVKWATDALPFVKPEDMIFIVLKEHDEEYRLVEKLREIYSDKIAVLKLDNVTEGAALSVLFAKDIINTNEDLIIYNTDQYFEAPIEDAISGLPPDVSGLIPVSHSTNPKWSYVKTDSNSVVTQVAEKDPISTYAIAGLYYFRHGKDFVWAAQQMISKNIRHNNEFYISLVYNELISRGDNILAVHIPQLWDLGSPESIEKFEKYYK